MAGPYDEGVPARAALREAIAALQNLHALLRSPRVGAKAIAPLLPEIVVLLRPLGGQLDEGLGLVAAAPVHRRARDEFAASCRSLADSALAALEHATSRGIDARSRLALELELERLLPPLEGARELVDAFEVSREEGPVELDLRDLIDDVFAPSSPAPSWGRVVPVTIAGPLPSAPTCLRPRTGRAVLVGALGWVGRAPGGEGGGGASAVLLRARLVGGRAYVELGADEGEGGPGREIGQVRVSSPVGSAPSTLAWAASLGGGRARFLRGRPGAVLLFPTSAPK